MEETDFSSLNRVPYGAVALAVFLTIVGMASFVMAWLHVTQQVLGKTQAVSHWVVSQWVVSHWVARLVLGHHQAVSVCGLDTPKGPDRGHWVPWSAGRGYAR